ncbi:preprotein translocase subunit YajC [Novosphingobium sp. ZN18A2]|uniref:preprotein translocase subunit YajC n=1 Tax=Novosphingobium sp. ZN18A2 TaxID=3079861 RepID=UPI0030D5E2A5
MRTIASLARHAVLAGAALAVLAPLSAFAQQLEYDLGGGASSSAGAERTAREAGHGGAIGASGARTTVTPYLEVTQNLTTDLKHGGDVLTYTSVAAGADASISGRNTEGAVSVRYERRFGESGNLADSDTVSGLARVRHDVVPRTLSIEAGGMAARTRVEASGAGTLNPVAVNDAVSQVWSAYAGPSLTTHAGDVAINGSYMAGYTKVGSPHVQVAQGQAPVDIFDHSVTQSAQLSAGVRPGTVLPVGLTGTAGYNREDISNLDQRVTDFHARADMTVPLTYDFAVVAGIGYEDVQVSSRDAVRDANGNPVIGADGRYVTDGSAPRVIAYDTSGLIWDAGVVWRPSRRTALQAYVGRRYGTTTYWGSLSYIPDSRSSLNVAVYDGISGFGGQVGNAIRALPTDFEVSRDPFNGNIDGCAIGSTGGSCVNGALSSLAGSVFRARGVSATYGHRVGRMRVGIGVGYNHRKYIAAPGTVLAVANGTVDESWYVNAGLSGPIDRVSSFSTSLYANWFKSGQSSLGDATVVGANASYFRNLTDRLIATAAVGVDGVDRRVVQDELYGSALLGLRYNF